jgi:hypothetical protein
MKTEQHDDFASMFQALAGPALYFFIIKHKIEEYHKSQKKLESEETGFTRSELLLISGIVFLLYVIVTIFIAILPDMRHGLPLWKIIVRAILWPFIFD